MRDSFPDLFGNEWKQAADVFYERYKKMHTSLIKPIAGVPSMLIELNENNICLCVVSNKRGDLLRIEADRLGWSNYFKKIVGASDAKKDKPSIEPIKLALNNVISLETNNIWFIGDTDIDMESGYNANCVPILMRQNDIEDNEFLNFKPVAHFRDSHELCRWIRTL